MYKPCMEKADSEAGFWQKSWRTFLSTTNVSAHSSFLSVICPRLNVYIERSGRVAFMSPSLWTVT